MWCHLQISIDNAIQNIENQGEMCPISKPEDILEFDNLYRPGAKPILLSQRIEYVPRAVTPEERRKQRLIDNPKMLFFYTENSRCFHDRECKEVRKLLPGKFEASNVIPENREFCSMCKKKLLLRLACYPNTKQIAMCTGIFQKYHVGTRKIEHYVMDAGMRFHATDFSALRVESGEDRWIIKGIDTNHLELWHNNYIKINSRERHFTEGFHEQNVESTNLTSLLNFIESYSWEKHLELESIAANEDTEDATNTVLMKDASTEKETNSPILRNVCVAVIILVLFTAIFGWLSSRYQQPWTALYVTSLTTAYHFIMRLIVGEVAEKLCNEYKFKTDSFGFRIRPCETRIYKTLRVKKWKKYAITAKPEKFDLRSISLEAVLHNMMQAELVHRIIMLFSFVPLLLIIPYGAPMVFLGTSIVACLIDMKYVIIQRYNRIRVQRIIRKKSTSV